MANVIQGALVEYAVSAPPLALVFQFNPQTISRTRTISLPSGSAPGTRGGYDFTTPLDTPRVAQGVTVQPEQFSVEILLDSSDRPEDGRVIPGELGIEPELATLRSMVEPKSQGPGGMQTLASLGLGGERAFQRSESASILLFIWGTHILPVFLTSVKIDEQSHLSTLIPSRATATIGMQIIEATNPFYTAEQLRQVASAALNTAGTISTAIGGIL